MEGMRLESNSCSLHLTIRCPGQHRLSVSSRTVRTATHVTYLVSVHHSDEVAWEEAIEVLHADVIGVQPLLGGCRDLFNEVRVSSPEQLL